MARRRWSFFMSPLEHGFIRWLDDRHRGLLTAGGQAVTWALLGGALMNLSGLTPPLVALFAGSAAMLGAAVVVGAPFRPRLRLRRRLPPPPMAGEVVSYSVEVENTGGRNARRVVVQERDLPGDLRPVGEPPVIDLLRPGERRSVTLQLSCASRGAYRLGRLQGGSAFPAELVKWPAWTRASETLLVYPRPAKLGDFELPHSRQYQPGGISVASNVGESTEFLGTREWRHGDRLRDVHWPSTARTGRPIVKEFQEEYFVRLALAIDVQARNAREEKRFEQGLAFAAAVADRLARRDYLIDLVVAGEEVHRFQAGRALAHLENVLELLACAEPGRRFVPEPLLEALLSESGRLSAVVFVVTDWDESRARVVAALRERGVAVRVASMNEGASLEGLLPEERLPT